MAPAWMKRHWAALAVAAITATLVLVVRLEGRVWFCQCQTLLFWIADAYSEHTSQHLFDPYSLTHLQHGLIFYWALAWLAPRANWQTRLVTATGIEALWEIVENSEFVINRYREATAALGYTGDSVLNSVSDIAMMALGFLVARRLPVWWSVAIVVGLELIPLIVIRDNLTLNVWMLLAPNDSIRTWQAS